MLPMWNDQRQRSHSKIEPKDAMVRAALFAALWWVLNFGDGRSWIIGAPVVIAAAALSCALSPTIRWRWSWIGAIRFTGFFLWHSFRGGVDVAGRAFHPRLPLRPGFFTYTLRLPAGAARVFLANAMSLQPGALSAELEENRLTVHALDTSAPVLQNIQTLETHVAEMFRINLASGA